MSDEPIWYSIPVSGELYERLEQAAKERGKTVDQLVDEALQVSAKCECHQEAGDSSARCTRRVTMSKATQRASELRTQAVADEGS